MMQFKARNMPVRRWHNLLKWYGPHHKSQILQVTTFGKRRVRGKNWADNVTEWAERSFTETGMQLMIMMNLGEKK